MVAVPATSRCSHTKAEAKADAGTMGFGKSLGSGRTGTMSSLRQVRVADCTRYAYLDTGSLTGLVHSKRMARGRTHVDGMSRRLNDS